MRNRSFLIAILTVFTASLCMAQQPAPVKVNDGLVQGTLDNGLAVYKGIPFAAPPIGELRWRAPQPVKKWKGVLQTLKFAPAPMQGGNPPSGKSEDCLYLNVWTPAKSAKDKIPVLVWIYGGGFSFGSTAEPGYNCEKLAKKGVVVVSIAYRVGQFGFLAHPELSAENPNHVSGNYGLLDQIAGMEWIQKNIAAFGGDPDKVTIFGESAGGISVSMLCASPLAKGLFLRAISESGGSFGPTRAITFPGENMKTLKQAEIEGEAYAQKSGISSIAELRKIPADKLPIGMGMEGGWPITDGYIIPDDQYKLYQAGKFNDVDILIGYNSDEGASFSREKTPEEYISGVKTRYGKFADELIKAYPAGETSVSKTARDLARDAAFGWHTWAWANLQSEKGKSKVFYYYFDQHPDYPENSPRFGYGSPHGQEVGYVFMNLDPSNPQTTQSDLELSETMGTYWTNFAKHGDPNGEDLPRWTAFSKSNREVMYLGPTPHTGPVPSAESLEVLDRYFKWRRTTEGKEWGAVMTKVTGYVQSNKTSVIEDFKPSSVNQPGKEYPQVNSENRVRVQISAPEAKMVQLDIGAVKYDLTRDEKGVWTGESAPQDEGFHYYQLWVDGAAVPDPGSLYFYGASRWGSGIEVPAKDQDFYALKDVPHGEVSEHIYYSKSDSSMRRCFIYTPPGYYSNYPQRYPVLYLQHGGGEDETGWCGQGHANLIMDNLIAEGKANPYIIVMDNGTWRMPPRPNGERPAEPWPPTGWADRFMKTLLNDIIPMIDANYRTLADQPHRAMAGLSMGGMQTRIISLAHPERFSYIGIFSGGSISPEDLQNAPEFKEKVKLVFISYGSRELDNPRKGPWGDPKENTDKIKEAGMNIHFYVSPLTAHEWQSWRRGLYQFAQLVFKK